MPEFLEITEKNYPNHYKLLKSMKLETKYSIRELEVNTGISIHTVRNMLQFLRETINFVFKGEVHHLAKHQISKIYQNLILLKKL